MKPAAIIMLLVFLALAGGSFVISFLQFREKGFLFNNAWFWASPEDRRQMDADKASKKPYYRQSGFAFLLIGVLFLISGGFVVTDWVGVHVLFAMTVAFAVVWAIVSSVKIERQERRRSAMKEETVNK